MKIELSEQECNLIIKGLESISKAESTSDLMMDIFSTIIMPKKEDMSAEELKFIEEREKKQKERRDLEEIKRATAHREIEKMKAKITLCKYEENQ